MTQHVMVNSTTKSRLAVVHGMQNGQPLVVACGYNGNGEFGYFICTETVDTSYSPPTYQYTNIVSFTRKHNEGTFQRVLKQFRKLVD